MVCANHLTVLAVGPGNGTGVFEHVNYCLDRKVPYQAYARYISMHTMVMCSALSRGWGSSLAQVLPRESLLAQRCNIQHACHDMTIGPQTFLEKGGAECNAALSSPHLMVRCLLLVPSSTPCAPCSDLTAHATSNVPPLGRAFLRFLGAMVLALGTV